MDVRVDYKESWVPKNWCFWTVVLEKILESPLDCKEIQPVHRKGDQSWIFIGRTDVLASDPCIVPYSLTVVLQKTLDSPLDSKEIQPVHRKGNQSRIFTGRTDAEAEAPTLWPPDVKSQLIGKDADAGKDWRWEEKGATEHEMVGWHHRLNGHEFKQTPRDGDGQGSLACCSPWGHKESDMT